MSILDALMKEAERILLDLKRKIFKSVYFFCGEEPYYIDMLADYLEANAIEESEREFNQTVVYGKETDLATILSTAKQYPMLSEKRVVIVREAQELRDLAKKADPDDDEGAPSSSNGAKQLQAYVSKPLDSTILVFCYKHKTFDKRTALAKALQKHAEFLETKRMYDNQLPGWIASLAKEKGYAINSRAAFIMAELLGNDLSRISNELDKLLIALRPGEEVSEALVKEKVGFSKEFNIFELQDALSSKDVLKANRIVNYFAANEKENPLILVLGNLFGYFSKVLRYHALQDKSKFSAAQALGVNPFFVEGYARAASSYPSGKLFHIFSYLKECDLRSKGIDNANVPNGELLKELVYKILH
jgi:DNA polymerase III subunit delta